MRKSRAMLAATLLGSAAVSAGVLAGSAFADTHSTLGIASFGGIAVDGVHKQVFVSDPKTGQIVVTDYKDTVLTTVKSLPGVLGIGLSADSGLLYAAVPDAHAIVAISTTTRAETTRYPVGDTIYPRHVVLAGGKLWFGYDDGSINGNYGSVDPADSTVHLRTGLDTNRWYRAPDLYAGAAAPGKILVMDNGGGSSGALALVDVSSGTESETGKDDRPGDYNQDAAFAADGSHLLHVGLGNEWLVKLSDMTTAMTYPGFSGADGVDVASDGRIAFSAANQSSDTDVYVYQPGAATASQKIALPRVDGEWNTEQIVPQGIAWQPGGPRLFAVATNDDGAYRLWTLNEPTAIIATMTVKVPATVTRGTRLTVSGTLTATPQPPAGTKVTVTRTDLEVTGAAVCTTTTDATGAFSCTDTPQVGGTVSYRAAYDGDADYAAAAAIGTVTIPRATPSLALSANGSVYAYGATATFTATLGGTYKNRTVEIWADPYGSDLAPVLVKKAAVNSAGKLAATVKLTRNTTVTAKFTGDARYGPRAVTSAVSAKTAIALAVSKQYKTGKIGSTKYYYFHTTTNPYFTTTIPYYANRKQKVFVEYYTGGKWTSWTSALIAVQTNGKSYAELKGSRPAGSRFRVRAAYLKGTSGDSANYTTYSSWTYFTFTK